MHGKLAATDPFDTGDMRLIAACICGVPCPLFSSKTNIPERQQSVTIEIKSKFARAYLHCNLAFRMMVQREDTLEWWLHSKTLLRSAHQLDAGRMLFSLLLCGRVLMYCFILGLLVVPLLGDAEATSKERLWPGR